MIAGQEKTGRRLALYLSGWSIVHSLSLRYVLGSCISIVALSKIDIVQLHMLLIHLFNQSSRKDKIYLRIIKVSLPWFAPERHFDAMTRYLLEYEDVAGHD